MATVPSAVTFRRQFGVLADTASVFEAGIDTVLQANPITVATIDDTCRSCAFENTMSVGVPPQFDFAVDWNLDLAPITNDPIHKEYRRPLTMVMALIIPIVSVIQAAPRRTCAWFVPSTQSVGRDYNPHHRRRGTYAERATT
jgi:hypothetical protein